MRTGWLSKGTFAVHLANRIRRASGEPNREISVRIFADLFNLDERHILRVLAGGERPSRELLVAAGAKARILEEEQYRFDE